MGHDRAQAAAIKVLLDFVAMAKEDPEAVFGAAGDPGWLDVYPEFSAAGHGQCVQLRLACIHLIEPAERRPCIHERGVDGLGRPNQATASTSQIDLFGRVA